MKWPAIIVAGLVGIVCAKLAGWLLGLPGGWQSVVFVVVGIVVYLYGENMDANVRAKQAMEQIERNRKKP